VILPQFIILPLALLLVWLALTRGIRPLAKLQQRIRRRDSTDLSPIDARDVPDEVAPLVGAINELLTRLDQSIRTQKQFLADAAHQLKTPLAGLRMQAELAGREIDTGASDAASLKRSLRQIAASSQRAAHMVNQLLAMARAEDREQALRKQQLNLASIVKDTVRDFVPKAMDQRIDLGYEGPDDDAGVRLQGQPVLVREMVRNLVDNALQYTPGGGTVTARVVADPFGQVVVLQVEDNGPGIAEAEREAVFQPFYRPADTLIEGSGLGLAIVREVAEQHGATITIDDALPPRWPRPAAAAGHADHGALSGAPGVAAGTRFARAPCARVGSRKNTESQFVYQHDGRVDANSVVEILYAWFTPANAGCLDISRRINRLGDPSDVARFLLSDAPGGRGGHRPNRRNIHETQTSAGCGRGAGPGFDGASRRLRQRRLRRRQPERLDQRQRLPGQCAQQRAGADRLSAGRLQVQRQPGALAGDQLQLCRSDGRRGAGQHRAQR
jgi:signal transduction histidine kinase